MRRLVNVITKNFPIKVMQHVKSKCLNIRRTKKLFVSTNISKNRYGRSAK